MTKQIDLQKFAKGGDLIKSKKTNDCVIYTRVSTKEQADNNLSLETQKKGCQAHVLKLGYNVLAYFGGTYESAASDERKEFKRMIEFCKKQKAKVSYIVVYSLERFSRTGDNAIWLSRQLRELGITIISVTQPIDTSNPSGVLQQNILFLFGQYDNDLRKQKSMAGTKEKLLRGIWCTKPPLGYDTIRRNGERTIEINATGKLLRKAFLWKANENIGLSEIAGRLKALKFNITIKQLHKTFVNPFYCGMLVHRSLDGEIIKGIHDALVSQEVFLKVNDYRPRLYGNSKNDNYEKTPLRGLLKCDSCGEVLRGYIAKAKGIFYYKCNSDKKCGCNKSANSLHNTFLETLGALSLNEDYKDLFVEQLKLIYNNLNEEKDKVNDTYQAQLKEIDGKIERLEERFINEELKSDLYEKFATKFKEEKEQIMEKVKGCTISGSNLDFYIKRSVQLSTELPTVWSSSDYTHKQKLQNLIFPEGIYYNKKNDQSRTPKINSVFLQIAQLQGVLAENNKGFQLPFSLKSPWAERKGFEPSIRCRIHTFSRRRSGLLQPIGHLRKRL
jgi:site-specific DNA recombinase